MLTRALAVAMVIMLPATSEAADHEVRIANGSYAPARVVAAPGDTITFVNLDERMHTATADDASFDTGRIAPQGRATVTVSGPVGFVCRFHPRMSGTVVAR